MGIILLSYQTINFFGIFFLAQYINYKFCIPHDIYQETALNL